MIVCSPSVIVHVGDETAEGRSATFRDGVPCVSGFVAKSPPCDPSSEQRAFR